MFTAHILIRHHLNRWALSIKWDARNRTRRGSDWADLVDGLARNSCHVIESNGVPSAVVADDIFVRFSHCFDAIRDGKRLFSS